ncbi:molybdenum cofactor biosynthesis protein MoaE [Leucothrix arctica]|uniref:Molybdopterin synthase catalytic subunit n=1 Tax=Leucothrix arctica TaxID=1481894 RepID=A0A317CB36_9GAMM|nr:molybdenum cofactor biosynthesis protein MoaE [Leucothrix arctica]PWQ94533.1 molybdopterin converting factor [Leucothrix arctica]
MNSINIHEGSFDPWHEIISFQNNNLNGVKSYGATASFVGTMRDFNEGDDVVEMVLEHYPLMTQKQLESIVELSIEKWPVQHVLLSHRVGLIQPSDPIVLVVVWSAHRAAAFDACRHIMEELKHKAPFWKKESLLSGESRWVSENTPDTRDN